MFESLKHWMEKGHEQARLFDDPHDELLHLALASLLYRVIEANDIETTAMKSEFAEILKHEFDLNDAQIRALYERVHNISCDLKDDLETIASHLKDKPVIRLNFMSMLSRMIDRCGVNEHEMAIFYEAQRTLFPEIQTYPL